MVAKLEPEAQPKTNQELEAEESKAGDEFDPAKPIKNTPIILETLHRIFPLQAVQAQDLNLADHVSGLQPVPYRSILDGTLNSDFLVGK
ncbi:hypothetical protein Bca4012_077918 [Brassica carinata]